MSGEIENFGDQKRNGGRDNNPRRFSTPGQYLTPANADGCGVLPIEQQGQRTTTAAANPIEKIVVPNCKFLVPNCKFFLEENLFETNLVPVEINSRRRGKVVRHQATTTSRHNVAAIIREPIPPLGRNSVPRCPGCFYFGNSSKAPSIVRPTDKPCSSRPTCLKNKQQKKPTSIIRSRLQFEKQYANFAQCKY